MLEKEILTRFFEEITVICTVLTFLVCSVHTVQYMRITTFCE